MAEIDSITHRLSFTLRKNSDTHFCYRISRPQGQSAAGRSRSFEKSNNLIGNQTCNLPACSIVPQPTTLPRAPPIYTVMYNSLRTATLEDTNPHSHMQCHELLRQNTHPHTPKELSRAPPPKKHLKLRISYTSHNSQYPKHTTLPILKLKFYFYLI
jgi:hypothetical protein